MYRIYEQKIQEWIDNSKKALLIYGARQVGKTYLIEKMLKENNLSYFSINLYEREDIRKVLLNISSAQEISMRLALYSDEPLIEGESIIFIDEIQYYPEIVTKIKFLVEEGKYRYILSGSNLGVELKGIKSMPVGYVESFQMYPMTFYEFALAVGAKKETFEYLGKCFDALTPVDEIIHSQMTNLFYYYLICGGMPAAVKVFINERNLRSVRKEQNGIIEQYKTDFTRYEAQDRKLKIISVYDSIPPQLNKQNRRFIFSQFNQEMKFDRYENSFLWLKDAAVAIPVYISEDVKSPLITSKSTNLFKLFQSDVGLLTSSYPDFVSAQLLEMNPEQEINNGALFENFVAQELNSQGITPYYFKTTKIGEIDFLIEWKGKIVPIEVKSGKGYKKHKAIDNLIEIKNYNIEKGYVLSLSNIEVEDNTIYLPIYLAGMFTEPEIKDTFIDFDIFKDI